MNKHEAAFQCISIRMTIAESNAKEHENDRPFIAQEAQEVKDNLQESLDVLIKDREKDNETNK